MTNWSSRFPEFEDSIAASGAFVGTDLSGQLIVPASNENSFDMTGGQPFGVHDFFLEFDALVRGYAGREFRNKAAARNDARAGEFRGMVLLDTNVVSELMRPKPSLAVENWISDQPAA